MAGKTFISYKFSEAQDLRDEILDALGEDATYYQGETAESPDLTDSNTESIKKSLTDMMYDTSVTIVVVSPSMAESSWIDWEIEYCLKEISRSGRTSLTNGVVGVIQEVNGGYDWLVTRTTKSDGCVVRTIDESKLYGIIRENRANLKVDEYTCNECKCISQLDGSYVALVDQQDFLKDPTRYIENAFDKSERTEKFDLSKQR